MCKSSTDGRKKKKRINRQPRDGDFVLGTWSTSVWGCSQHLKIPRPNFEASCSIR